MFAFNDFYISGYSNLTQTTTPALPATFQMTVSLLNGWNMVSIPGLHPVNQNVTTWWSGKDLGYQPAGDALRGGMHVEDDGVSRGDHADPVGDDGRYRVRAGGDGAEHAVRSPLHQGQAVLVGPDRRLHVIGAGGLRRGEGVLRDLVPEVAEPSFPHRLARQ